MALEDILIAPETAFPGAGIVGQNTPSPGPRIFGSPFRTANGYLCEVQFGWPAQVLRWTEDAFNACGFDVARLWAVPPLFLSTSGAGKVTSGEVGPEPKFYINFVASSALPDFPNDYINVDHSQLVQFGTIVFNIWDGLPGNALPFGGRRFFMETILHGIGHVVGSYLAAGQDLFKRHRMCLALAADRIRGDNAFGRGAAWRMWNNDFGAAWALRPQERFAEAFKDIWGLPSAHTFTNRTRAPFISIQAIIDEAQVFLPINGIDARTPGSSYSRGFQMSQLRLSPNSIQAGCNNLDFPCFDPKTGGGPANCVGCNPAANPNIDGFCGHSFSYPLTDRNYDVTWSMIVIVPKIGFCRNTFIQYGPPAALGGALPRRYMCPGIPFVGAEYEEIGYFPNDVVPVHVEGTRLTINLARGTGMDVEGMPDVNKIIYAFGVVNQAATFVCHVEPNFVWDLNNNSKLRIEVNGWAAMDESMFANPGESFDFLGDPYYVNLGWRHIPGRECRMIAPSTGRTFNPYGQMNLDGFAQGGARAPKAVGQEAAVVEPVGLGQGAPITATSLTIVGHQ